jgi:hypothetical protein
MNTKQTTSQNEITSTVSRGLGRLAARTTIGQKTDRAMANALEAFPGLQAKAFLAGWKAERQALRTGR